jgi:Tol biopolymer transport system component
LRYAIGHVFLVACAALLLEGCVPSFRNGVNKSDVAARPLESIRELTLLTTETSQDANPRISPDGRSIAFVSDKHGNSDIFVADPMGRNPLQITLSGSVDANPAWTQEGRSIIFDSTRLGYRALFRIDLDNERIVKQIVARGADDFAPSVSPDGKHIAFGSLSGEESLWLARIDGSDVKQIGEGIMPKWEPRGDRLLFVSSKAGNSDIWMVNPDGRVLTQLTVDSAEDRSPSWSPDGRRIVFSSNRTGNFDLWMLNMESGMLTQLTNHPGDDDNPAWSPEGKHVYFDSWRGDNRDLWRLTPVLD